jgi:hypothetical protein
MSLVWADPHRGRSEGEPAAIDGPHDRAERRDA